MVYLTSYILVNRGIVLNHSQYTFIYINLRHSVFRPDRHAEHRRWPVAGPPGGGGVCWVIPSFNVHFVADSPPTINYYECLEC